MVEHVGDGVLSGDNTAILMEAVIKFGMVAVFEGRKGQKEKP